MDTSIMVESLPPRRSLLRVALVTETFPPEVNGVAMTVDRLARSLQARDHDLQIVRPRQSSDVYDRDGSRLGLEQVLTRGLPIPRYPELRLGLPAKRSLQALWSLRRPDVVHIATEGPLGWSALRVARKLRLPVSTDFRTNFHAYSRHYGLGWMERSIAGYLRRFHNQADCTLVPTNELQDSLAAAGFERLIVVERGVDADQFSPNHRSQVLRSSWGLQEHDMAALYVGRLAPEKNLSLLVQAFEAMQARNPRWRLVVVGDGPERAALAARCPSAVMLGSLTGQALSQAYASSDLFLFPSLTETFGNVVPEAMSSGLPVLAFGYAAAAQLVRIGQNGELATCGDHAAFVRLASDLAVDIERVSSMGQHARAAAAHLAWPSIAERVERIWRCLLDAHAAGGEFTGRNALWWPSEASTDG